MMECLVEENDIELQAKGVAACSFDQYLDNKLKYGPAQRKYSMALMLMLFSEGSESIVLGLIIPVLAQQWGISTFQKSLLITGVYIGVSIGSALQTIADTYGRYHVITLAGIIQVVAGLLSAVAGEYSFFLVLRFIYGIGIGIVLPLSGTYILEVTPTNKRAEQLTYSRLAWTSGTILTSVMCYFFIAGVEQPRWRTVLVLVCLPGVLALYIHIVYGRESPRFLLLTGRTSDARAIMSQMESLNRVESLSQADFQLILHWVQLQKERHGHEIPFSEMISRKYKPITYKLLVAWFTVCFIYYGTMLLLPLILARNLESSIKLNYSIIIAVSCVELLGFRFSYTLMEHPAFGRKNTARFSFLIAFVTSTVLLLFNTGPLFLGFLFMVIKFSVSVSFLTLYPFTAELYHTLLRSKALGVTSLAGRIATIFLGIVGVYALQWMDGKALYLIFVILALSSYVCMTLMPYDTLGKELDNH